MISLIFNRKFKNKVKDYLIKKCKVKNLTDADVLESCLSLYYLGRSKARYLLINKLKPNYKKL